MLVSGRFVPFCFLVHNCVDTDVMEDEMVDGLANLMDENGILWDDMDTLPDVSDAELDRVRFPS